MRFFVPILLVVISGCGTKGGSSGSNPNPQPNPQPQVTCAAIKNPDQCNFSTVKNEYCAWNPSSNTCQVVKSCADIPTRDICDSNLPAEFGGCTWDSVQNKCIQPNPGDCDAKKDSQTCDALGFCYWNPAGGGECDIVQNCSNFNDNPGREEQCDNFNHQGLSCVWSEDAKTCKRINQCSDAIKSSECAQHQFGGQYCEWNSSSNTCSAISTCAAANTSADCQFVADPLQCMWDSQASACELLKPAQCPDIKGETRCEQYSFANPKNPDSNLNCQWTSSGTCAAITGTCSTITDTNVCDLNKGSDGLCYLDGNVCQVSNGCAPLDTQSQCSIANQSYGQTPACRWDSAAPSGGACERTVIQTCPQIKDAAACEVSNSPVCQWTSSGTCAALPATCPLINNASDCNSQTKHSFDCEWQPASNTCAAINSCSDVKIQADCNATKYQPLNCAWINGVCQNSIPTTCAEVTEPATCAATKFQSGPCFWNGSSCATLTSCAQLTSSTSPTCEASSFACYLNGSSCVPGACNQNPSVTCNTQTSEQSCSQIGCTWTAAACPLGNVSQSSCPTNDCTWNQLSCDGTTSGSCVSGCTWCNGESGQSSSACSLGCTSVNCGNASNCASQPSGVCTYSQGVCAPTVNNSNQFACYGGCVGTASVGTCTEKISGRCDKPQTNTCDKANTKGMCQTLNYCQWGAKGQ